MTDRLYYHDPFLYDFEAEVREQPDTPRPALILDRTAFYPTSGGQVHDTGWILDADQKSRVTEVADVLLAEGSRGASDVVEMTGLQLPRILGISVVAGDPIPIDALRGDRAADQTTTSAALLPVPVVPETC